MKQNNLAIGEFATIELLKNHFSNCNKVIVKNKNYLSKIKNYKVKIVIDPKYFDNNIDKKDIYVVSEFSTYKMDLDKNSTHILLFNINDEGEMGTIIRTAVAFGYKNIALINSNIDIFSPKLIRASTGALFMINLVKYKSKGEYLSKYKNSKYLEIKIPLNDIPSLNVGRILYKNKLI